MLDRDDNEPLLDRKCKIRMTISHYEDPYDPTGISWNVTRVLFTACIV